MVISLPLRKSGTTGALGKVRPLASRRLERIGLIMKNHDEKAREFIDLLTIRGILGDKKIKNEDMRVQKQEKARNSYHNTLLLLQQYRTLVWLMECFPETVAEELDQPFQGIDKLLEQMDLTLAMGNRRMENRLEGTKKTRILLDRINEALTVLKKKPGDGKRLYQILYLTYITPEPLSHAEILYRLEMSSRNYYRLRQQAITILSIRLWSAPSTDVDFWLEMLEFLEKME